MKKISEMILDKGPKLNRSGVLMLLDAFGIGLAYFIALLARFNFKITSIPTWYLEGYGQLIWPIVIIGIIFLWFFQCYKTIWRFASVVDLRRLLQAFACQQLAIVAWALIFQPSMPRTFWLIGALVEIIILAIIRFSYRVVRDTVIDNQLQSSRDDSYTKVMVIGAGSAGRVLIREMRDHPKLKLAPVCVIDDNPNIVGKSIDGVPIVGNRYDILEMARKYEVTKIVFAIPSANQKTKKDILKYANQVPCHVQTVPGLYQLVDGQVSVEKLKDVSLNDLLGREPVTIDNEALHRFVEGKVVLVTGGGGSIGSELCRQLAVDDPKQLIIFDIYENNAYDIEMELRRKYPNLNLLVLIGSVRDIGRVDDLFATYKPDIVYHAAAHKHVPLMEVSPHEAIKNNVFGTYNVAKAALKYKTQRFTLISTDKAVNPTNIMGASKRLCEMVVQMMDRRSLALGKEYPTKYSAVRFGNVLGSSGSVIPLFRKQIKDGGPVTVTDKRIVRYFMTIPEAVSLVLQSSYYAKGGEIFILDMGDPVKIDDMARNLIRLSGFEPDVDIQIIYTGLRPGEKLYEEMLMSEEGLKETENKLIHIGEPIVMDDQQFEEDLKLLHEKCYDEHSDIEAVVAQVLPTYHPELGGKA